MNALNDGTTNDLHSVVDDNGMPVNYPLYASPAGTTVRDGALTASCMPGPGRGPTPQNVVCGDYAVNTIQPTFQPYAPGTALTRRLPPQIAADDWRPAECRRHRLGLVLWRVVEMPMATCVAPDGPMATDQRAPIRG